MKRIVTFLLAVVMCIGVVVPVYAEDAAACPGAGELHTLATCTDWVKISEKEAVCGEQGYTLYQCNGCKAFFADNWTAKEREHDYDAPVVTEATCTVDGKSEKTCKLCGKVDTTVIKAQGHVMGEWTTNGVSCGPDGVTRTRKCNNCDYTETESVSSTDHNWVIVDETLKLPETCGATGSVVYKCTICSQEKTVVVRPIQSTHEFEFTEVVSGKEPNGCQKGEGRFTCKHCGAVEFREIVDPNGGNHKFDKKIDAVAPTCTATGVTGGFQCSICGIDDPANTSTVVPALGHDYVTTTVAPTCTSDGSETKTCSRCGDSSTTTIPSSVAHVWKTTEKVATCTEFGGTLVFCELCGKIDAEKTTTYILDHKYVANVTVAGDCTTDKVVTYTCSGCGDSYAETTKAPGHNMVAETVAPTCTEKGYTYDKCTVCGATANKRDYVDARHTLDTVVVAPTCVAEGYTYDKCSACAYESDKRDVVAPLGEVAEAHTDTTKLVHMSYIINPTCTSTGTSKMYCPLCNYITEDAVAPMLPHKFTVVEEVVAPTCTAAGYTVYKCEDCDATENRDEVAALGHNYVDTVVAPTCETMKGWTEHTCSRCGDTYNDTEVTITLKDLEADLDGSKYHTGSVTHTWYRDASCTLNGYDTYQCDACGHGWLVITEAATGHSYTETKAAVPATCTSTGWTAEYTCSACGDVKAATETAKLAHTPGAAATCTTAQTCTVCSTVLVAALGHTEVVDAAVAATCTKTGLTEGKHCSVCNTVLVAQTVVGMLAHTPGAAATCTTAQTCTVCSAELVAALGHTHVVADYRDVTCEKFGYEHFVCEDCGDEYVTSYVKELGHDYVLDTTVDSTCDKDGYKLYVCSHDAKHNYTETIAAKGHKNANGDPLTTDCTSTVADRLCVQCNQPIEKAHNFVTTEVKATCNTVNYTLHVCTVCQYNYTDGYGVEFGDHEYDDWTVTKPATITTKGEQVRVCKVCKNVEIEEIPCLEGIHVSYDVANGVSEDDDVIVNSGIIALTVKLTATDLDVWGFRLQVAYTDCVEFESYELLNNVFDDVLVNANNGVVSVMATVANEGDKKQDVNIDEADLEYITLYFRVAADAFGKTAEFTTKVSEAIQIDNSVLVVEPDEIDKVAISKLADVNGDGVIDIVDAGIISSMVTGESSEEYSSEADIDKDGEITVADFAAVQKYLVDMIDYNTLALSGVPTND